jgi:ubiquitin-protein ligase
MGGAAKAAPKEAKAPEAPELNRGGAGPTTLAAAVPRMERDLGRIMLFQQRRAEKEDHPHLLYAVDEADARVWHFMVVNLPAPYEGGEFLFRLRAPDDFPQRPPELAFLTPTGVFEADSGKVCISIGEFHGQDRAGREGSYGWRPVLGMIGFAGEVVNALVVPESLGGGIRVRNDDAATKAALAATSAAHNAEHHPRLCALMRAAAAARPDSRAAQDRAMWRAAGALSVADFAGLAPEELAAALEKSFGADWRLAARAFASAGVPPEEGPACPERAATTARLLAGIGGRLRETLAERDGSVRRALLLGLNLRLLAETGAPPPELDAALASFLPALAGAAGSWRETLPPLVGAKGAEALGEHHEALARFLREKDIDRKAALGGGLAAALRAAGAEKAAAEPPTPPASPKSDGGAP